MPRHKMKVTKDELVAMINSELNDIRTEAYSEITDQRINSNFSFTNQYTDGTRPSTNMSRTRFFFTPQVVQTFTLYQSKIFYFIK